MDWIPNKVAILGGGVIGVEFASIWRSFGAEVVIIEGFDRLVPNEDPSMSKGLERAYRKRGIEFKLGNKFKSVTQSSTSVTVELENGEQISADLLLVAVGRAPNATGFGYEEQGVAMDRGFVLTNERLATNLPASTPWATSFPVCSLHTVLHARNLRGRRNRRSKPSGCERVGYPSCHLLRA